MDSIAGEEEGEDEEVFSTDEPIPPPKDIKKKGDTKKGVVSKVPKHQHLAKLPSRSQRESLASLNDSKSQADNLAPPVVKSESILGEDGSEGRSRNVSATTEIAEIDEDTKSEQEDKEMERELNDIKNRLKEIHKEIKELTDRQVSPTRYSN